MGTLSEQRSITILPSDFKLRPQSSFFRNSTKLEMLTMQARVRDSKINSEKKLSPVSSVKNKEDILCSDTCVFD